MIQQVNGSVDRGLADRVNRALNDVRQTIARGNLESLKSQLQELETVIGELKQDD